MSLPSRADVLASIAVLFPPEQRARALALLDEYTAGSDAGRARVQMAILVLSDGDLARLESELAVAKRDFRDVLVGAENTKEGQRRAAELARRRHTRP